MNAPEPRQQLIIEESRARRADSASAPLPVPVSGNATSLLAALTSAANNPHMDIGKVERMFAMHQTVMRQEAEAAFNDALARAQAGIHPIAAKTLNSHTGSRYAKLAAVNKEIVPLYTAQGLSLSYDTETKNDADPIPAGMVRTIGILSHAGGHSRRYHIDLPPDSAGSQGKVNKTQVQAAGSTNSYARRYLALMIFNVSTEDDNDGNSANKRKPRDDDSGNDAQDTGRKTSPEFYPDAAFLKNLPAWKKLIEDGKKTADQIIATVGSKYRFSEDQLNKIRAAGGTSDATTKGARK